jgi:hypothetical protein
VCKQYEIDLSLLLHHRFLDRVHSKFYELYVQDSSKADIKPVILECFKSVLDREGVALVEQLYFGKDPAPKEEDVYQSYEAA